MLVNRHVATAADKLQRFTPVANKRPSVPVAPMICTRPRNMRTTARC